MTDNHKKILEASYARLHHWVKKMRGKATYCSIDRSHIAKRFEWANISREYKEDLNDFMSLCPSCHRKYDMTEETKEKMRKINAGRIDPPGLGKRRSIKLRKPVLQYSVTGEFIKRHGSIGEASVETNTHDTSIGLCLKGKYKTAGGYIWKIERK